MSHSFKQLPWDGRFVGIMHATPPKQLPWDGRLEGIMHSVLLLSFLLQRPMQTVGADGWMCLESCEVRLWREVLHQEEWLKEDSSEEFFFLYLLPFPLVLPDMIKMVGFGLEACEVSLRRMIEEKTWVLFDLLVLLFFDQWLSIQMSQSNEIIHLMMCVLIK